MAQKSIWDLIQPGIGYLVSVGGILCSVLVTRWVERRKLDQFYTGRDREIERRVSTVETNQTNCHECKGFAAAVEPRLTRLEQAQNIQRRDHDDLKSDVKGILLTLTAISSQQTLQSERLFVLSGAFEKTSKSVSEMHDIMISWQHDAKGGNT